MRNAIPIDQDFGAFLRMLNLAISAYWPTMQKLDSETGLKWLHALRTTYPGITLSEVDVALDLHATSNQARFGLKPADIIANIHSRTGLSEISEKAYGLAIKAVNVAGRYKAIMSDDPYLLAAIAAIGGWPQFCTLANREEQSEYTKSNGLKDLFVKEYLDAVAQKKKIHQNYLPGDSSQKHTIKVSLKASYAKQLLNISGSDDAPKIEM